jgi:glutamate N-acetyltransferase/amino-acid N-acetyltransferase
MKVPLGYRFAAGFAGLRKTEGDDVGLIVSDPVAHAAAVFTQNIVQAAPIQLARRNLRTSGNRVAAILVNAGNANCATRNGIEAARTSCKAVAKALRTKPEFVLPASTGVIGVELEAKLLTRIVPKLAESLSTGNFEKVANAILTTDTKMKTASEEVSLRGGPVRIAGMTKGSGMIHPNMATTLGFILTDAEIGSRELAGFLREGVETSYNALTVDGEMSTNDVVALLANGAAGIRPRGDERGVFGAAVKRILENLAEQIAGDGEGAEKLIVVRTLGFRSVEEARRVARTIANSPLVKTAVAGSDPNWGRILAAAGYSGVEFDPGKTDIYLQNVLVCQGGLAAPMDEGQLKNLLDEAEVEIRVVLRGKGQAQARFFTCDLTEGYIRINGSYRT